MPEKTNIVIKNGTTSISPNAFYRCSNLTSVTIPASVTEIGSSAFRECSDLTSVISEIQEPFVLVSSAFRYISSTCSLTVPYGTKDAYIAAGWTEDVFKGGIVEAPAPIDGDNVLYAEERTGHCGRNVTIPVLLKTGQDYAGLECQVTLPAGFTLASAREGTLLTEHHTLTANKTGDHTWQILVYTSNRTNFTDTEGTLLELTLGVENNVVAGTYDMVLSNIVISDVDLNQKDLADSRSSIIIDNSTLIGDATNDGRVNVTDIMAVANRILKIPMVTFNEQAADINGDGRINVTDIMGIANIILKINEQ